MGPEIGDYIARQVFMLLVAAVVVGALLATLFIFGLPALWGLIKPFLHEATK